MRVKPHSGRDKPHISAQRTADMSPVSGIFACHIAKRRMGYTRETRYARTLSRTRHITMSIDHAAGAQQLAEQPASR